MSPENCDKCGANFEAILDWQEGRAERERQLAALQGELERTKLARNAAEAKLAEAEREWRKWQQAAYAIEAQLAAAEADARALREALKRIRAMDAENVDMGSMMAAEAGAALGAGRHGA